MAPSIDSRENLYLPATRQKSVTSRIPGLRRRRGMLAGPADVLPARAAAPASRAAGPA